MDIQRETTAEGRISLAIVAPPDLVDKAIGYAEIEMAADEEGRNARGAVPGRGRHEKPDSLEKRKSKKELVLEFLVPFALSQENIFTSSAVEAYTEQPIKVGKALSFVAYVTPKPRFALSSYDPIDLIVPANTEEATEDEVDRQLALLVRNIREQKATTDQSGCVEKGSSIIFSIAAFDGEGSPLECLTSENMKYIVGRNLMPPGFDEGLIGAKVGESKTIRVKGPVSDASGSVSEMEVVCDIHVKELLESTKPIIDDAWIAANIEGASDWDSLRTVVKRQIEDIKSLEYENMKRSAAADELGKRLIGTIPDDVYEYARADLTEGYQESLARQGLTTNQFFSQRNMDKQQFLLTLMVEARQRLRQGFSLDALADHLNLSIEKADIDEAFRRIAPVHTEEVRKHFESTGRMYLIREAALRNKANDWLLETARISYADEAASRT